ncbi:MAG: hypothetical protein AABZ80_07775 [Gemmatimonadota bacterium]
MPTGIVVRAPTRIDLGGGWTDVPPYCDREGGFVCNVAISRYATATIRAHGDATKLEDALLSAVTRRAELAGEHISVENDFPVGAGLGGSSAASAALLVAAAEWRGIPWNRRDIAEAGRAIEVEDMGIAGGRQDHYAAAFGGALALTFGSTVKVQRITLDRQRGAEFVARCVLVYTGESRISGGTITAVLGAWQSGEKRVVNALARMRDIARQMAAALEHGEFDLLGSQLDEHWHFQRDLHPSIPTPRIDEIIARGKAAGALGAKAMGASGGGCVLLFAPAAGTERVRAAVAPLGTFVDFGMDMEGVTVVQKREP